MNHWHRRFLDLAIHISTWSKDPSTKVGAVIAKGNLLISLGYNGPPKNIRDMEHTREIRLKQTIHAEVNAIISAKRDLSECTLYCTHLPCANCTSLIIQSDIKQIYALEPTSEFKQRWKEDLELSHAMLTEACITLRQW